MMAWLYELRAKSDESLARSAERWSEGAELDDATRERFAKWLRRLHGGNAKKIGLELDAHPTTVRGWLAGGLPNPVTRVKIVNRFGAGFLAAVVAPDDLDVAGAALRERIEQGRAEIARLIKELDEIEAKKPEATPACDSDFSGGSRASLSA